MLIHLNILFEQIPRQKAEREFALPGADVEEVDGVADLDFGDVDVDGAEVLEEAVADEDDARVEEEPEFLVGDFEGDEVVAGARGVEVTGVDAGPFGEVVDDGLGNGDVVIYEGDAFVFAAAAEDGDARKAETGGTDNLAIAGSGDFDFFLLEGDEFGVDRDRGAWAGGFCMRIKESGRLRGEVTRSSH